MHSFNRAMAILLGALAAVAAVVAGVASAAKVSTRSSTVQLPVEIAAHTATAKCPKGEQATGGGIRVADPFSDAAEGAHPVGKRRWRAVGLRAPFATGASELTSLVRCLRGAKLTTRRKAKALPFGARGVTAKCPRGRRVAGGGIRLARPDEQDTVLGSFPVSKRKWRAIGLKHSGSPEDSRVTAYVRCIKAKVRIRSRTVTLPGSGAARAARVRCPEGRTATGGGIRLGAPLEDAVGGSFPVGRRAWRAIGAHFSFPPTDGEMTVYVVCV